MKSTSLVSKLVTTFTVILAISYMIIATVLSVWVQRNYINERRVRLQDSSDFIEENVKTWQAGNISKDTLVSVMDYLGNGINKSDVILVDERNLVYFVSREGLDPLLFKEFTLQNLESLRKGKVQEILGEKIPGTEETSFAYINPVMEDSEYRGAVVILTPERELRNKINSIFFIIWIATLISLIASVFIIYYFAQRVLIRPLHDLNEVAKKMNGGDFSIRAHITSDDEIGQLGESFNRMAGSMESTEDNRRDFISNISHELRSPITSIRGFIAGMIDGIIPKDKENYYLSVVYEEIQRLTRLINDLLDLSAMESGQFSMKLEQVDLNEIIRIVLVKFETRINDKRLKVDVTLDSEYLYVAADRDRLIQVVTNLLDNAVKHCPDDAQIEVVTKVKGKKVTVSIYNDGTPISEEDRKNIWNRFYKADKSRTKKESTGLGLPIVRNIIAQHGETAWVENRETGVVFSFTLTRT